MATFLMAIWRISKKNGIFFAYSKAIGQMVLDASCHTAQIMAIRNVA